MPVATAPLETIIVDRVKVATAHRVQKVYTANVQKRPIVIAAAAVATEVFSAALAKLQQPTGVSIIVRAGVRVIHRDAIVTWSARDSAWSIIAPGRRTRMMFMHRPEATHTRRRALGSDIIEHTSSESTAGEETMSIIALKGRTHRMDIVFPACNSHARGAAVLTGLYSIGTAELHQ